MKTPDTNEPLRSDRLFDRWDAILFFPRIAFFPMAVLLLAMTAACEAMMRNPDWKDWRLFNTAIFENLPRWPWSNNPVCHAETQPQPKQLTP